MGIYNYLAIRGAFGVKRRLEALDHAEAMDRLSSLHRDPQVRVATNEALSNREPAAQHLARVLDKPDRTAEDVKAALREQYESGFGTGLDFDEVFHIADEIAKVRVRDAIWAETGAVEADWRPTGFRSKAEGQ